MTKTFSQVHDDDLENVFFNTNEFAVAVTVKRGSDETASVAAIEDTRTYEAKEHDYAVGEWVSVDFDILASAYQINSVAVDPQDGDVIEKADGDEFEVLAVPGRTAFSWADSEGKILRVHTKRIVEG